MMQHQNLCFKFPGCLWIQPGGHHHHAFPDGGTLDLGRKQEKRQRVKNHAYYKNKLISFAPFIQRDLKAFYRSMITPAISGMQCDRCSAAYNNVMQGFQRMTAAETFEEVVDRRM